MIVHVKLYASLRRYRPQVGLGQTFPCSVPDDTTLRRLIFDVLSLPAPEVKIMLVNGVQSDLEAQLREGDSVALWPPIAGGYKR